MTVYWPDAKRHHGQYWHGDAPKGFLGHLLLNSVGFSKGLPISGVQACMRLIGLIQACGVKRDRGRIRHIQAFGIIIDIDSDKHVAMIAAQAAQTAALSAKHDGKPLMGGQCANLNIAFASKASNQKPVILQLFDGARQIHHADQGYMIKRS